MSSSNEPADKSKPVVKGKDPHNYRKVGYSMIVISVSLVLIGLLVWAIGDNYHFASDIMANQEIYSMTPNHGYNIMYFDNFQPIGSKLKLLEHADTLDAAQSLEPQYKEQYSKESGQVILFSSNLDANGQLISNLKAAAAALAEQQAAARAAAASQASPTTPSTTSPTTANQSAKAETSPTIPNVEKANINATVSATTSKSVTLSEKIGLNTTTSNK